MKFSIQKIIFPEGMKSLPGFTAFRDHASRLPLYVLVVLMITYVVLRAVYVSFTHDEAFTFFNYVVKPIETTLDVTYTNNHLLNSLLVRFTRSIFGDSEFVLRLPNVLGGVLFYIFSARLLLRMHPNRWMALAGFVLLTFNPFVTDFFGLCRGYGLSLGLLMVSLYYQFMVLTGKRFLIYETAAIACTAAAVLANYTLFNFFLIQLALNVCVMVYRLIGLRKNKIRMALYGFGFLTLCAGTAYFLDYFLALMLKLNELGNFNFGGDTGFWTDSVGSLAEFSCYHIPGNGSWISINYLPLMAAVIFASGAALCTYFIIRKKWSATTLFALFLFLSIAGCACAIWVQNIFLHIPFSKDRTVIYFIPLASLLALSVLYHDGGLKWLRRIAVALFFVPVVAAQVININLDRILLWPGDMNMEQVSDVLINRAEHMMEDGKPIGVVMPYDQFPSFNYYMYIRNCHIVQPILYDHVAWWTTADLAIDYTNDSRMFADPPYRSIVTVGNKQVKQRLTAVKNVQARFFGSVDFENNEGDNRERGEGYYSRFADRIHATQPFSRTIHDSIVDSLGGGNVYLLSCCILAEQTPTRPMAVISVIRNGQPVLWQSVDANSFVKTTGEWQYGIFRICPDHPILAGDKVDFYMLNDALAPVLVDNLEVEEFRVE